MVRAAVYRRKLVSPLTSQKYYCTGILFTYENGGQRAVGECRIKADDCVVYERPVEMVFDRFNVGLKDWCPEFSSDGQQSAPGGGVVECVYVKFRTEDRGQVDTGGWIRPEKKPMADHVGLWMAESDTFISFSSDTEGEVSGGGEPEDDWIDSEDPEVEGADSED